MATIKSDITLKHQANLGEDIEEVEFAAGSEVEVLHEWNDHFLIKDDAGQLFNVGKGCVDA